MITETKQLFFKKLIEDTLGYYRVYDFLKSRVKQTLNEIRIFNNSETFWKALLQRDFKNDSNFEAPLRNNQIVKLRNFYLTEWVPKLPGRVWTKDGDRNLIEGITDIQRHNNIYDTIYNVLGPKGKNKMVMGGFGSVRVKPKANGDYCMLLNAVSVDDWHCDFGIPIIVSKSVYEQYLRYSQNVGAPEIAELTGVLILNEPVNYFEIVPAAIGAKLEPEIKDMLSDMPNLPKCFIYVSSPLNLTLRYNNSHPEAIAWTMFKTNIESEPIRLTYARFNPIDDESSKEAIAFINEYVFEFNGTEILTDFDGQKRRLVSKSTLADTRNFIFEQRRSFNSIRTWIRRERT